MTKVMKLFQDDFLKTKLELTVSNGSLLTSSKI